MKCCIVVVKGESCKTDMFYINTIYKRLFKLGPIVLDRSQARVVKVSEQGPTEFELESVATGTYFSRWHFAYFIRKIKAPAA